MSRLHAFLRTAVGVLGLLGAALVPGISVPALANDDPPPVVLRELYVPYAHFRALTEKRPDGVVMELAEYRSLVDEALRHGTPRTVELPPVDAVVIAAQYDGAVRDGTARFTAILEVAVTRDGWVSCDLGAELPPLGRVTVDEKPGWLVLGPDGDTRARLLLRGLGRHRVELGFSLPARDTDDSTILQGPLVRAGSSVLELSVPGEARGTSTSGVLDTTRTDTDTHFRLSLGRTERFELQWQRRKSRDDNPVLLIAEHRLSLFPRSGDSQFIWEVSARVSRRKTDRLVFREPLNATTWQVNGPLVHSWDRTEEGLVVQLKEPVTGSVSLVLSGRFPLTDGGFTAGPPALIDAYANPGTLALVDPRPETLEVTNFTRVRELAPDEVRPLASGPNFAVARVFAFTTEDARVSARVVTPAFRFESRASYLLRLQETQASLDGFVQVEVRDGRAYELDLNLPAGWNLTRLAEVVVGAPRGFRREETPTGVRIELARAIDPRFPLRFEVHLERARTENENAIDFVLPHVPGPASSRTDLGIAVQGSLYLGATDLAGWRALPSAETRRLGLEEKVGGALVAGLTTEVAAPRVNLGLARRNTRGEYRAVTYVLAAERAFGSQGQQNTVRVRCDLRLAVVDRAVEELTILLPALADDVNVIVLGPGIREITGDNAARRRTLSFTTPWLGIRQLRVEYETPASPGTAIPIPELRLDGDFGNERFVVLQSQGSVEVESTPGPGLSAVDLDEVPDFAEPWTGSRLLRSHRFRAEGDPGTLSTVVHERAPVVGQLAQELEITTILGEDGTARTRAQFLLAYAKAQALRVEIPDSARYLSVTIDGEPIRSVRVEASRTAGRKVFAIPLPPRSYAHIAFVYESPDYAGGRKASPLGSWGSWSELGPVLSGIPVGTTRWTIHHPEGYRFMVAGGNLRPVDSAAESRIRTFASAFFGRMFSGRLPIFTVGRNEVPRRPRTALPAPTPEEIEAAQKPANTADNRIDPRSAPTLQRAEGVPHLAWLPEGRTLVVTKFGGEPQLILSYQSFAWWDFSKQAVFLLTLLGAFLLRLRRGLGSFLLLVFLGLAFGLVVPTAFSWESPLLVIPFCEGLVVAVFAHMGWSLLRNLVDRWRRRRARPRFGLAPAAVLVATVVALSLTAGSAVADDPPATADPFDPVLIPYGPESPPWVGGSDRGKVYIPDDQFRRLWKLAHPEAPDPDAHEKIDLPFPYVIGDSEYRLRVEDDRYRLDGVVYLFILDDSWVTLPLPFDQAQLARIQVDGTERGVAQKDGRPTLELRGFGAHRIDLELAGRVTENLGESSIATQLLKGAGAHLEATLPAGAVLKRAPSSVGASPVTDGGGDRFRVDLGPSPEIRLVWSFPKIEGQLASQAESLSYALLQLDPAGFVLRREEKLRITGRPLDRVVYEIRGDWEITSVVGSDISEWSVERDGSRRRLRVFFSKPVNDTRLRVLGVGRLAGETEHCTLSLENAVRQESYVGLLHGGDRRFTPESLAGLERTSRAEASSSFPEAANISVDRVYKTYGSGSGERLGATPSPSRLDLATEAIGVVQRDQVLYFVRSRVTRGELAPIRHRVEIPANWRVRKAQAEGLRDWRVETVGGRRELVMEFTSRARPGRTVVWSAEQDLETLPDRVPFPGLAFRAESSDIRVEQTVLWALAADEELELLTEPTSAWEPLPVEAAPKWLELPEGTSHRAAFRTRRSGVDLLVRPVTRPSQMSAAVVSFARLAEEALLVNARILFRVQFTGRDRLRFRLPAGAELVYAETRNLRSQTVGTGAEGAEVTLDLQSPTRGDIPVDLVFKISGSAAAGADVRPIVIFDGARRLTAVDYYVGVVQTERTFTLEETVAGLSPVELEAMPFLPAGVSDQSLRPTYRANTLDWNLRLTEQEIEMAAEPDAMVRLVDLTTRIGGDGTVRTQVIYSLTNKSLQFLTIELPMGARLWGVTVNGRPVPVGRREDAAGILQIPVERVGRAELSHEVAVVYEEPTLSLPSIREVADLVAPRILNPAVEVRDTIWSVQFPDDYTASEKSEVMRQEPPSLRHATKLSYLLEQQEAVRQAAQHSDSKRARERATQGLARLEQALGDNLAELELSNRSSGEMSQRGQIGERIQQQWLDNDRILVEAKQAQKVLQADLSEKNKKGQTDEASRDEEAFNDRARFLQGKSWRGGRKARPGQVKPQTSAEGAASSRALLERYPYDGWKRVLVAPVAPQVEFSTATPIGADQGLRPLPDAASLGAAPSLKISDSEQGTTTFTFQRLGADARLQLVLSKRGALPRVLAWIALVAAALAVAWWIRDRLPRR